VLAFAGHPTSEVRSNGAFRGRVDALFYGCKAQPGELDPFSGCDTIFWIVGRERKLAVFWTTDPRFVAYSNRQVVHVGTRTEVAERAFHEKALQGCSSSLTVHARATFLTLVFIGGKSRIVRHPRYSIRQVGGRVDELIVHSVKSNPGVIDCVDS
jgi:hypothetical protein